MMSCGIPDKQWIDYLDQSLSCRERGELEAHFQFCEDCRSQLNIFRQIDRRLRIECGLVLQSAEHPGAEPPAYDKILEMLGVAAAAQKSVPERLWQARWVLALLCGPVTATRMIAAAESHAEISADTEPTGQKWSMFLRRLSYLTTEICGCSAGALIWAVSNE